MKRYGQGLWKKILVGVLGIILVVLILTGDSPIRAWGRESAGMVKTAKTEIDPVIQLPDYIVSYTEDTMEILAILKGEVQITGIDGLSSFDYAVRRNYKDGTATVTFALTDAGEASYCLKGGDSQVTADCNVIISDKYNSFSIDSTTVSVGYNEDTSELKSDILNAIEKRVITMGRVTSNNELSAKTLFDCISVKIPDSAFEVDSTIKADVMIDLTKVMNAGDKYYPNYVDETNEGEAQDIVAVAFQVEIGPDDSSDEPEEERMAEEDGDVSLLADVGEDGNAANGATAGKNAGSLASVNGAGGSPDGIMTSASADKSQGGTVYTSKDKEPQTGDETPVEMYKMVFILAGVSYLLLDFIDRKKGMTRQRKKELTDSLAAWGRQGGALRRAAAVAAIFFLLAYYHSIGKQTNANWKEEYGK